MDVPNSTVELEKYARQHLPGKEFSYFASGKGDNITLRENIAAFKRWKIIPRCMQGVNCFDIDTKTNILGETISVPICASPTGLHKLGHPDGELATAQGCYAANTCMAVSAFATFSYEEIAKSCPSGLRWCQMYIFKDRDFTVNFIRRAEKAGYKALVITVDTNPLFTGRDDSASDVLPDDIKAANFNLGRKKTLNSMATEVCNLIEPCMRWSDIKWLKSVTKLPVVLKGILSVEDAMDAVKFGVDGILVSNKGGRNLDVVPTTLDVLPGIVAAVQGKLEIYIDGGVRCGTDVFRALALGANAVFMGRPVIWGLVHNGAKGVKDVFEMMNEELKVIMANTGCQKLSDINKNLLIRQSICPSCL